MLPRFIPVVASVCTFYTILSLIFFKLYIQNAQLIKTKICHLLGTYYMPGTEYFIYLISHNPSQTSSISSILQMRKLRCRKVKSRVQGHTAMKWAGIKPRFVIFQGSFFQPSYVVFALPKSSRLQSTEVCPGSPLWGPQ